MFPSKNTAQVIVSASIITLFAGMANVPTMAASPLLKTIPTEAIGNAGELDDSVRPSVDAPIYLSFALSNINSAGLKAYADGVTDTKSPLYHEWLKPNEIGQKFGAPASEIKSIESYLAGSGFTKISVFPDHMFISAQGSRGVVEQALGVKVNGYDRDQLHISRGYSKTYYAPDRQPSLPSDVAAKLTGIFGLSNKAQRIPTLDRSSVKSVPQLTASGYLEPADISAIYGGATLHAVGDKGAGETIAIFSPTTYAATDVATFEAQYSLTGANVNIVNVDGGATDANDQDEACLDIETIIGQAPAATVDVYEAPNVGNFDIFNAIETADPDVLSMSYGTAEDLVNQAYADAYEGIREVMATEGISMFVSSGDTGAYGDPTSPTTVTVSVDTSSAYVTSVGGTELVTPFVNTNEWNGEIAWTYNDGTLGTDSGSSGGLSVYIPEPSWQIGTGVANSFSDGMRQVPDVSACASYPYYYIYTGGAWAAYGGTSASCPVWASSVSLIEEALGYRLGCINPQLYAVAVASPGVYHDITHGNDGKYGCTAGWDYVTGWGSADFGKLETALSPSVYAFPAGLQMISVPYTYPTSDTISELITGLVTSAGDATDVVAAWQPQFQNYVISPTYPATYPLPGQGYWARFNATSGGTLQGLGTEISSPYYGVTLQPGWNMVGDPFINSISIDNITVGDGAGTHSFASAVSAGDLGAIFYSYTPGIGYVANTFGGTLTPYAGYWIYSSKNIELTFYSN